MSEMPELYWSPTLGLVERRDLVPGRAGEWLLLHRGEWLYVLPADAVPLRPVAVAGTWTAEQEQAVAEAVDDVQHKLNADELDRVTESVMRTVLPWLRSVHPGTPPEGQP